MNFWDQQYSAPAFKYGKQANWFLRNQAARLHPGSSVLLPGDGEGRNSVCLARRGHHVTAVDNSRVGLEKASRLASESDVAVALIQADLEHWVPTPDSFDAVVLTYVHLPAGWRRKVHQRLIFALRPGEAVGLSVAQGYQEVVLIASVPLSTEPWRPLQEGEVVAVPLGRVVSSLSPSREKPKQGTL